MTRSTGDPMTRSTGGPMTSPFASPDQLAAHQRLLSAVAAEVAAGQRVPCLDRPALWVSDDPADTEAAAQGCLGCCSALDACRRYIEQHHEAAGVS